MIRLLAFVVTAAVAVSPLPAAEESADWSAGVASVKITPDKPLLLSGYAARVKPFESIDQDIYARALALKDVQGHAGVIVTIDLTVLPADVADPVRKQIADDQHLDLAAIVLSISHTHSAPLVALQPGEGRSRTGKMADDTAGYTRSLQKQLVEVAAHALSDLHAAKLSWGTGVANFVMNRREFTDRGVILGVNPRGLVDRSVPVLRIDSPEGKLRAVLFGYACHNTTMPSHLLAISGDYAGYARAYIEQHNPGAEALFMMGCGGDANPYPREQIQYARDHGQELGKEVCRVLEGKLKPIHGLLTCAAETADLPLQILAHAELEELTKHGFSEKKAGARQMLAMLDRGQTLPASHRAPVIAWQFGTDLTFVALPDEVVVGYMPDLERAVGPMRLWVAAYCNQVEGYIPTRQVLQEGGYETLGLYDGTGWFAPEVEDVLVRAARDTARKAGRPATESLH